MKERVNVLVSNIALPPHGVGSWTFEINHFLNSNDTVDYVLSPTASANSRFLYCKKRNWPKLSRLNRDYFLANHVAKDYLKTLLDIGANGVPMSIMVVDDQVLLSAVASIKSKLPAGTSLIFYYHGHAIVLNFSLQEKIDRVLFLTQLGYQESLRLNERFLPEVKIVGNGVDSSLFFPLNLERKADRKQQLGFASDDVVVSWMANSRPVKGLHLFMQMIPELLQLSPKIKILIIGSTIEYDLSDRVIQTGSLPLDQVAEYLQISDVYFFTSLWKEGFGLSLAEAMKCGNFVIASQNGGIPEVIDSYPYARLISQPNVVADWIKEASIVFSQIDSTQGADSSTYDYAGLHSLIEWEQRLLASF